MLWSVLFLPAHELQQLPPWSNICLPDNVHSCTCHYLSIEYHMVDAVHFGGIGRKSVRERRQPTEVASHSSLILIIILLRVATFHCRVWTLGNRTREWALGEPAHSVVRALVLYLMWLQQNTTTIAYLCPEGLQVFQHGEWRRNWPAMALVDIKLNVKQGADAGQKTASVQCHCLIIEETLSRQLGLAGLLAVTLTIFFPFQLMRLFLCSFLFLLSLTQASDPMWMRQRERVL